MKRIWITSLGKDPGMIASLLALAKQYGLAADGHFFTDDPAKLGWRPPVEQLADPSVALWIIVGGPDPAASVGFGLTLATLSLAGRRQPPPILWLDPTGTLTVDHLPTLLHGATILPANTATLGPKLVAAANRPAAPLPPAPYRLAVHAHEGYGTWLEIGPATSTWDGSMVGVAAGGDITFQGVGPAGQLPHKALLEYPQQGLKIQLGDSEYTAWAVRNRLTAETSHFVKIDGAPASLLFGPYAADDQAEVFVVRTAFAT